MTETDEIMGRHVFAICEANNECLDSPCLEAPLNAKRKACTARANVDAIIV